MTVEVKLADGSVVKAELVKTPKSTPAKLKSYRVLPTCPTVFKGKQRQKTVDALRLKPTEYHTPEALSKVVKEFPTKFAVAESIGWHLHQLEKLGFVESK